MIIAMSPAQRSRGCGRDRGSQSSSANGPNKLYI